uniref:Uncharacterized protein n=1 Tax=Rhizophora mucronata TaxID=61149 RepID=A0A2P2K4R9_RHIMU
MVIYTDRWILTSSLTINELSFRKRHLRQSHKYIAWHCLLQQTFGKLIEGLKFLSDFFTEF